MALPEYRLLLMKGIGGTDWPAVADSPAVLRYAAGGAAKSAFANWHRITVTSNRRITQCAAFKNNGNAASTI